LELPEHRLNPRKGKQGNGPRQRAAARIGPVRSPAPQRHSPESKKVAALPLLPDCRRCRRTGSPSRCCCCGSSPPTDVEGWRIHATARSGSARSGSAPPSRYCPTAPVAAARGRPPAAAAAVAPHPRTSRGGGSMPLRAPDLRAPDPRRLRSAAPAGKHGREEWRGGCVGEEGGRAREKSGGGQQVRG